MLSEAEATRRKEWLSHIEQIAARSSARDPSLCPWCGCPVEGDPHPFSLWPTPTEVGRVKGGTSFHRNCSLNWMDWWAYGGEYGSSWAEARDAGYPKEPFEPISERPRSRFERLFGPRHYVKE